MAKTTKRTVKGRSFSYLSEDGDRYITKMRGEEVDLRDLSEREIELAEENSMFEPVAGEKPKAEPEIDITEMSVEELAAHIEENKLNVGATVALAGEDADYAQHVLDAENAVTGREPRDGVVKGLEKILGES